MTTLLPYDVESARERIAEAARAVEIRLGPNALALAAARLPIRLSGGEADLVGEAVMKVLGDDLRQAQAEWEKGGAALRTCLFPGCTRQFDLIASVSGTEPAREIWSSAGWMQHRALGGAACPDHAQALWASGQHVPQWRRQENDDIRLVCECGWSSGEVVFRGHGITLWQAHAVEVLRSR